MAVEGRQKKIRKKKRTIHKHQSGYIRKPKEHAVPPGCSIKMLGTISLRSLQAKASVRKTKFLHNLHLQPVQQYNIVLAAYNSESYKPGDQTACPGYGNIQLYCISHVMADSAHTIMC